MGIGMFFLPNPVVRQPQTTGAWTTAWSGPRVVPVPSINPAPPQTPVVPQPKPQVVELTQPPQVTAPGPVEVTAEDDASTQEEVVSVTLDRLALLARHVATGRVVRACTFVQGGRRYVAAPSGELRTQIDPATGSGQSVGELDMGTGHVWLHNWDPGSNTMLTYWSATQARPLSGTQEVPGDAMLVFRTAAAPLRPQSLQITAVMQDGTPVNVSADADGRIVHSRVVGSIDYESGVGSLVFRSPVPTGYGEVDLSHWNFPGLSTVHVDAVMLSTLRYNAVAYESIPVDPAVIGVDPVRLPSDGRVPVFNRGDYVVVHNTQALPARTVTDGEEIAMGRARLSRIWITGADGRAIKTGWSWDLDAGTLRVIDSAAWAQPVTIEHSVEHMARVREVDVGGAVTLTLPCPHDFPIQGSYLSTALMLGDRFARVAALWDQLNWDGSTWVDHQVGQPAVASYNDSASPLEVDNRGAITERWVVRLTSPTHFQVIGENVGVVATGSIHEDCSPINPITSTPYFTLRALGWGTGWVAGNVLRINTVGASSGFCVVRAVQPGAYTSLDHRFALMARIDVDRP